MRETSSHSPWGREEKEEEGAGSRHWHTLLSQFSLLRVTAGLGAHLDQWTLQLEGSSLPGTLPT